MQNIQLTTEPDTEVIALRKPEKEMDSEKTEWYKRLDVGTKASTVQTFPIETGELTGQIEKAKKDIDEMAKNCETEIVEYAAQEIQRCKETTLNYIEDNVEAITAETLKRRIEIINNFAQSMQQCFDDDLCLVKERLQNYSNFTLEIIEENSLKQVQQTVHKIGVKANSVTMEDLVHLTEKLLNQILKDTRKNGMDELNMLEKQRIEYLDPLYNKLELDCLKEAKNENQRYEEEIMKLLEEEIPRRFRKGLNIYHDELKSLEVEAMGRLNVEAVKQSEKVMNVVQDREGFWQKAEVDKRIVEEMHRNLKMMRNLVKDKTQKIKKEAMISLLHHAQNCEDISIEKKMIDSDKIIKQSLQETKERRNHAETKHQNLRKETEEYLENVVKKVRDQAVKKVTEMVPLIGQNTLRSALKHSAESELIATVEVSPEWLTDAMLFCLKGFQANRVSHLFY